MSHKQISRSHDLQRLRNEGYNIEVRNGLLLMHEVPYVTPQENVERGIIVSKLKLRGDTTSQPGTHVVDFIGKTPSDAEGRPLKKIIHSSERRKMADGVTTDHKFSSKPKSGKYENYYDKMATYATILTAEAQAIDPNATPKTFPAFEENPADSVFEYVDTASSRAGIGDVTSKLEQDRVAIVGLGGTGSYILDFVAKTPVKEIHLFDGDELHNHNAFRIPGALSLEELQEKPKKVEYFEKVYARMRRGVISHPEYISDANVGELTRMDFVFLCFEASETKATVIEALEDADVPFIDAGMGLYLSDDSTIHGTLRVTTSLPGARKHVSECVSVASTADDIYSENIQVCDLNAFNAALAVVRWKKFLAFYGDFEGELATAYCLNGNELINEEKQQ